MTTARSACGTVVARRGLALTLGALVLLAPDAHAQSIRRLYADAVARETAVRKALAEPAVSETVLKAVRTVVANYENIVRHDPRSGYCDDALWRAGRLSLDAFEQFGDPRERSAGLRLLQMLASEYPTSRLAKQAPGVIAAATAAQSRPQRSPEKPTPGRIATIKDIRRTVLADAVRIVIELDGEVPFYDERLDNPVRVFLDLPSTRPAPELRDRTIRFETDADVVRQVRIGRHPNDSTRVVLDAIGLASYSVYALYNPFRLVIDCIREAPTAAMIVGTVPAQPLASTIFAPLYLTALPIVVPAAFPASQAARVQPGADAPLLVATATTAPVAPLPASPPARNLAGGFSISRQLGLGVSRIVIDPGHGGEDPGAVGKGITEAALVLDVALRLEKLLEKVPGVEVILTRRTDAYVPLQERTAIANREGADLFLSIHANASNNTRASGVETYILNFATNLSAAAVAARENAASGQAMGALPDFVKAIALNNKLDESRDLATYVQRAMIDRLRPANRTLKDIGVKEAPFVVLIGAAMPSVLTEVSFLTNAEDVRLLRASSYRERIAEALFEAIRKYQTSLKTVGAVAQQ